VEQGQGAADEVAFQAADGFSVGLACCAAAGDVEAVSRCLASLQTADMWIEWLSQRLQAVAAAAARADGETGAQPAIRASWALANLGVG
jgi:hypothetical protein